MQNIRAASCSLTLIALFLGMAGCAPAPKPVRPTGASVSIVLRPLYDRHPLQGFDGCEAVVILTGGPSPNDGRSPLKFARIVTNGTLGIEVSPGKYAVRLHIDHRSCHGTGGSSDSINSFDGVGSLVVPEHEEPGTETVELVQLLGLHEPERLPIEGNAKGDPIPHYRSPVQFSWDPAPVATTYLCQILHSWEKPPFPSAPFLQLSETHTSEARCRFELPPNRPHEFYMFLVSTKGSGGMTGHFQAKGGQAYPFIVDERR